MFVQYPHVFVLSAFFKRTGLSLGVLNIATCCWSLAGKMTWHTYTNIHEELINNYQIYFVQLQLFDIKFLFSKKICLPQAEKNNFYGRASINLVVKCKRENDDMLEIIKFWSTALFTHTRARAHTHKMRILVKRNSSCTVCTFWGNWSASI